MADIIDKANDLAEHLTDVAIKKRKKTGPPPKGRCHYCDEKLAEPQARFCDSECRDEWEREQRIRDGQFADGQVKPVENDD